MDSWKEGSVGHLGRAVDVSGESVVAEELHPHWLTADEEVSGEGLDEDIVRHRPQWNFLHVLDQNCCCTIPSGKISGKP